MLDNLEHNEKDILPEETSLPEMDDITEVVDDAPVSEQMPELLPVKDPVDTMASDGIWDDEFFRSLGIDLSVPDEPTVEAGEQETDESANVYIDDPPIPEEPKEKSVKSKKLTWQKSVLLYMHDLVFLLSAVIVVFLLLLRVVVVSGSSMNKTLYDGDYLLLVSNLFYRKPESGDIIVASKDAFKDGAPIVKRVIATEGQWVYIDFDEGIVYVGDDPHSMQPLDEPYAFGLTTMDEGTEFPLVVDEGCVFVLGDNRGDSTDSRSPKIGLIDEREIMGKVIFLFLPGKDRSGQTDFGRIGVVS